MSETEASNHAPSRKVSAAFDAIKGMSVQELSELIEKAEAEKTAKMDEAKRSLIAEFRDKAAQLGLPFESLMSGASSIAKAGKKKPAAEPKLPVKFKGPNGEEWSGRGRLPSWLQTFEAEGRKREEFAV